MRKDTSKQIYNSYIWFIIIYMNSQSILLSILFMMSNYSQIFAFVYFLCLNVIFCNFKVLSFKGTSVIKLRPTLLRASARDPVLSSCAKPAHAMAPAKGIFTS